jgi:protoheme IX farnesyltransferase
MILLGLLLMLGCIALAVDAVVQNTATMHAVAFNQPITDLSLGALFIAGAVVLMRRADRRSALRLYLYSLAYLAALFAAMVVDAKV